MSEIRQIDQSGLQKLEDVTTLWRYVSLQTLFFYLNGNVFLPSIATLRKNDPFESEYPHEHGVGFTTAFQKRCARSEVKNWIYKHLCKESEKEQINKEGQQSNYAESVYARHYLDFRRKTHFASCWVKSKDESAAMWSIYGRGGAAVATDIGKLKQVLAVTGRHFLFGQMRYIHSHEARLVTPRSGWSEDEDFLLRPYFLKRIEYKHEQEVRFVTAGPEPEENGGIFLRKVQASKWITKVRLWPKLAPVEEESLKKAIHPFIPGLDCRCSDLLGRNSPGEDWQEFMEQCDEKEDSRWHDCTDGIPAEMKEI